MMYDFIEMVSSTIGLFVSIGLLVLTIIGYWRIFEKAGIAGWKSLIPFYSQYCMCKIAFGREYGWLFILLFIPCVNFFAEIVKCVKLSEKFGHGIGFALGLIFLSNIFYLILGFDQSIYQGETLE